MILYGSGSTQETIKSDIIGTVTSQEDGKGMENSYLLLVELVGEF